jgi:tRNA-Thr(GGU) m(6)t(6)A37 methyltransferase TsaA
MKIEYHPIGLIRSPFKQIEGMPIQPTGAASIQGRVEVFPEYAEGLKDLDGFSHIILLYHFHRVDGPQLTVRPFLDDQPRGLFATRAPKRPNPIGLSIVRLLRVSGSVLYIENVDVLDETPLLDVKPYVPEFDQRAAERVGWLERNKDQVQEKRSDRRFASGASI